MDPTPTPAAPAAAPPDAAPKPRAAEPGAVARFVGDMEKVLQGLPIPIPLSFIGRSASTLNEAQQRVASDPLLRMEREPELVRVDAQRLRAVPSLTQRVAALAGRLRTRPRRPDQDPLEAPLQTELELLTQRLHSAEFASVLGGVDAFIAGLLELPTPTDDTLPPPYSALPSPAAPPSPRAAPTPAASAESSPSPTAVPAVSAEGSPAASAEASPAASAEGSPVASPAASPRGASVPSAPSDSAAPSLLGADEEELSPQRAFQSSMADRVQRFIEATVQVLSDYGWSTSEPRDQLLAYECLERYIVTKAFRTLAVPDKRVDWHFQLRTQTFQALEPHHFGVTVPVPPALVDAVANCLTQINFLRSPRNKLVCVRNACALLFNHLDAERGHAAAADDFLPLFAYVLVRANPPALPSNIQFVLDYRHPTMLVSSWGYFLTSASVALDYITHLDLAALGAAPPRREGLEHAWVLQDGAVSATVSVESPAERYRFWASTPEDLGDDEVAALLAEYKRLALFEYTTLQRQNSVD